MRRLALFDVDGTLTRRDTMFLFLRHALGTGGALLAVARALPTLVLHVVGVVDNERAKRSLLGAAFGGAAQGELEAAAATFADVVDAELRPGALERLRRHRDDGDTVLLVSASLDLWLAPWARRHELRLLATPTAWQEGRFAGLGGPNNHGPRKAERVQEAVELAGFGHVVGYGDSSGDTEMLALCAEVHFRPFRGG
jgi:phosphatidylglycerophosphatase C